MSLRRTLAMGLTLALSGIAAYGQIIYDGAIQVMAQQESHRISPLTTGACLEDVNHEVYGGIYSQMVYGESFEEPAPATPLKDFVFEGQQFSQRPYFGGQWLIDGDILHAPTGDGPKLIAKNATCSNGTISVDLRFNSRQGGNAGLIACVSDSASGADNFRGYEISLMPSENVLVFGRHNKNWEPIRRVDCPVPVDQWITLKAQLNNGAVSIFVNDKMMLTWQDPQPLRGSQFGLRTWQRPVGYRNLTVQTKGQKPLARPFQYAKTKVNPPISGMWDAVQDDTANGLYAVVTENTFNGRQSQQITYNSGTGRIGIANSGLNRRGMDFQKGKDYEALLWLLSDKPASLLVTLEDQSGKTKYAKKAIKINPSSDWQKVEFKLDSNGHDTNGRFVISLTDPATVTIGHAFLQPGTWGRFKDLPVRLDVAQGLIDQNLTILRYGGCMANAEEYRWKKMIGPRDQRPPYRGWWFPYSSNGWGIIEFIDFCDAAGFECVPDFNIEETPEDMADFIEYVNGDKTTEWGKKRALAGHPEPYNLKYIQFGNEETVSSHYLERFKLVSKAIWESDPDIILIVGDFAYNDVIVDPYNFDGAPRIRSLAAHREILKLAKAANRPIWFDVHIWNGEPREPDRIDKGLGLKSFVKQLEKMADGAEFKVCVFEENANNHDLRRGLGHAHAINEMQRYTHEMPILCSANCLQPDKQNDNGWNQGLLFLDQSNVWGQSPYYVTQMIAKSYQPICVNSYVNSDYDSLDVTACKSEDGKTLSLRVVNLDAYTVKTSINLNGYKPSSSKASALQIKGELDDINTAENPRNIVSQEFEVDFSNRSGKYEYTFPPHSFTIINFN